MKKTLSIVTGLFVATSLFAQTDNFETLKTKYEAARQKIESDAVAAYSNGLVTAGNQLKKKADLDNYLILQKEQERFGIDCEVDSGTTNSCDAVSSVAKKVVADRNSRLISLLKAYLSQAEDQLKKLMQADKIDEAKEVKAEMDKLKFEIADLESKLPKQPTAEEIKKAKTIAFLIGKWKVSNSKNKVSGEWTFKQDGTMEGGGTWVLEDNCVKVRWNERFWDTFNLPLTKSVKGDSWTGKDSIRATKMENK